jgi:uncharacterized protein YbjT (DUF2867 family)
MEYDIVLVTGATGYVGGRLIPALLESGYRVRAMARNSEKLNARPWASHPRVETVQGDAFDVSSLKEAAAGCRWAFYLIHSMIAQKDAYAKADRRAANNMVKASADAGVERIVYLGGLAGENRKPLSRHLKSRTEVARILQSGPVPTTVLRAPMILGSGSASFEIMRYLVERLPVMTTPRWVQSLNQPIAIRNVVTYLVGCLQHDETSGQTYDIGGPDVITYREVLDIYAEEAGLPKRLIIPLPVLTPTLSALWIHLVSPVPKSIALPLTQGLTSDAVCSDKRIQTIIPQQLLSSREAIHLALDRVQQEKVDTCWMDAGNLAEPEWAFCGDAEWAGGTIMRCGYRVRLKAKPDDVWQAVRRIGGKNGWYFGNFLWKLRGVMDRLMGGVGLRRGRRHPTDIGVGDVLDFWRVLEVDGPKKLVLIAEMKTPGEALLEFQIVPLANGEVEFRMLSRFLPRGLTGIIYWYALYPFHEWIFYGMLKSMAKSIQKPITKGPQRYTQALSNACALPDEPAK